MIFSLFYFLKRKQKCKRMALDPDAPSTSSNGLIPSVRINPPSSLTLRKKKSLRFSESEYR